MATRSETLDTFYTATWYLRRNKAVQQIYKRIPLYNALMAKGRFRTDDTGGRGIEIAYLYGEPSTVNFITKGSKATMDDVDPLTVGLVPWSTLMGSLVRWRADDRQNRGKAKMIDIADKKFQTLELKMKKIIEDCLFNGVGKYGSDAFYGLEDWAPTNPLVGTVGGINRATAGNEWHRSTTKTATTTAAVFLVKDMRNVWNTLWDVEAEPDVIVTNQTVYELYENAVPVPQMTSKKVGDAEYSRIAFKGVPVDFSSKCPDGSMWFLDSNHLEVVVDSFEDWKMTPWKEPYDMPFDKAAQIVLTANILSDKPVALAKIHTIA